MSNANRPAPGIGSGGANNDARLRRAAQAGSMTELQLGKGIVFDRHGRLQVDTDAIRSGVVGPQGAQGPGGAVGADGSPGLNGQNGADGAPGSPGMTGPQGEPGATGPAGSTGAQGPQGEQGIQGLQGPPGDTGNRHDVAIAELAAPSQLHYDNPVKYNNETATRIVVGNTADLVTWKTSYMATNDSVKSIPRDWRASSTFKTFGAPLGGVIEVPIHRYGDKAHETYSDPSVLGIAPGYWKCAFNLLPDGSAVNDGGSVGASFQRVSPHPTDPSLTEYNPSPEGTDDNLWTTQGYNTVGNLLVNPDGTTSTTAFQDRDLVQNNEVNYESHMPWLTGFFVFSSANTTYIRLQMIRSSGSGSFHLRQGQLICERWERIGGA